jgi:hypothetical protein
VAQHRLAEGAGVGSGETQALPARIGVVVHADRDDRARGARSSMRVQALLS